MLIVDKIEGGKIALNHGSGGRIMHSFIREMIVSKLKNGILERLDDSAVLDNNLLAKRLAMTTDSYVVNPIFFSGGDIGRLAVSGTVNDLTTSGAKADALSLAFIIEEGAALEDIRRVVDSVAKAAKEAQIKIVTGDTKVVEAGKGDKIYINTCGIGFIEDDNLRLSSHNANSGDVVMVTGPIGQHEIALLLARKMVDFDLQIESDVAPLNIAMNRVWSKIKASNGSGDLHSIKDPTRGGLAGALLEICENSKCQIIIREKNIPMLKEVRGVCELLGFDPLYLANEGRFLVVCQERVVAAIQEFFPAAKVIGEVKSQGTRGELLLEANGGGIRRVAALETTQLPRIC